MRKQVPLIQVLYGIAFLTLLAGCNSLPGKPSIEDRWISSSNISNFDMLYGQNCAGCHGKGGLLGAARPLNDPLYLALISKEELQEVITKGVQGTNMPAFGLSHGGTLTVKQIEILVEGMESTWARPNDFKDVALPPYSLQAAVEQGTGPGDPIRGQEVYRTFCARCHGEQGGGTATTGSIVDRNFLGLVSNQGLRTTVIAGRADLGKPDFRADIAGKPMTPEQISDVVAWLASQRIVISTPQRASNQL
jgi:cytochrome c oxidase cbb3-type subunit 3